MLLNSSKHMLCTEANLLIVKKKILQERAFYLVIILPTNLSCVKFESVKLGLVQLC